MKATGDNFRSDGTAVIPAGGEPQCGRNGGSWRRRGGGAAMLGGHVPPHRGDYTGGGWTRQARRAHNPT